MVQTRRASALRDISNRGQPQEARPRKRVARAQGTAAVPSVGGESSGTAAESPVHAEVAPPIPASMPVDPVDQSDIGDPQACVPYLVDIHEHLYRTGTHNVATAGYMTRQTDVNAKMRAILIDWLIEVHLKFKLVIETLYTTVNIIDRYLEKVEIKRNQLQLIGVTAMFLASKYEEIYAPECRDFVYISDKAYTREQILAAETLILAQLEFRLTAPTPLVFLQRLVKVAGLVNKPRSKEDLLANYFVEMALQDYSMLQYPPATIAAAAVSLALKTVGSPAWSPELEHHGRITAEGLRPCVRDMHALHVAASTNSLQAVRKKYAQEKQGAVSGIPPAASFE